MMWKRGYFYLTEGFNQDVSSYLEYDVIMKIRRVDGVKESEAVLYKSRLKFEVPNKTRNNDLVSIINSALKRRGVKLIPTLNGEVIFFTNRTLNDKQHT